MRKHDFWHVQWFLIGQKREGYKKAFLYVHFERFNNWLLFWQNKTPWGVVR